VLVGYEVCPISSRLGAGGAGVSELLGRVGRPGSRKWQSK
jgi:hypothetical protein